MKEIVGNLWDQKATVLCITTNGVTRNDGALVMGRGVAKECTLRNRGIEFVFGDLVRARGNIVQLTGKYDELRQLLLFPTKHHWQRPASMDLIMKSTMALAEIASFKENKDVIFILPRPGCGNGGLDWRVVKPFIENWLPDNVHIISKE